MVAATFGHDGTDRQPGKSPGTRGKLMAMLRTELMSWWVSSTAVSARLLAVSATATATSSILVASGVMRSRSSCLA